MADQPIQAGQTPVPTGPIAPATTNQSTGGNAVIPNAPAATPQPITPTDLNSNPQPTNYQNPSPLNMPDISGLGANAYALTPDQQQAQDATSQLESLNNQLTGKSSFISGSFANMGYGTSTDANGNLTPNDPTLNDLNTQLTALQNNAKAIPIQAEANAMKSGTQSNTAMQGQSNFDLHQNAIQALTVSSLIAAKQGKLAYATQLVNNAVTAKYGPIQDQITTLTNNLNLIKNSPEYTTQQKQQADQQAQALAVKSAQLDLAKTNYTNGQNEVLKYAGVADAQTLQKMQQTVENGGGPAAVAQIAAQAGVQQPTTGRYKDSVTSTTDAFGNTIQHVRIFDTITGQWVDNVPAGTTSAQLNANATGNSTGTIGGNQSGLTPGSGTGTHGLDTAQYGKLANTDFNPTNTVDQLAQRYLDYYIKKGQVPSSRDLGNGIKGSALASIDSRARNLFFQATGNPLPTPDIIKGYQDQLIGNNKLLNNLNVQEGTIASNSQLLLQNLKTNNVNSSIPLLNNVFNPILDAMGDPNVTAYLAQNSTISNELGSLLSLKNAQGTTVYDKLTASGLISKGATGPQISAVVNKLLQEATNAHNAIKSANSELYQQTDPLVQDANNPARAQMQNSTFVEKSLSSQGLHYDALMQEMSQQIPPGTQPALDAKTGKPGYATPAEIQAGTAIPL